MKRTALILALLVVAVPQAAQGRGGFFASRIRAVTAVAKRQRDASHKLHNTVSVDPLMAKLDRKLARSGRRGINTGLIRTTPPKADRTLAPYFANPNKTGEGTEALPLQSTSAKVTITGVIAQVQVEQVYRNRGNKPIEAVYVFPASTRAAVHGMKMIIGNRTITAEIQKRAQARATYNKARQQGRRTALLEQQRSNVFTMNVANIMPGDVIKVKLQYSELLVPTESVYEFVYPVVVGPRYGGGANPKTDRWLANPYLRKGTPVPYRFDIKVHVESPIGIKALSSPSHQVDVKFASRTSADVTLKSRAQGNRDFVLRYRLASNRIETGVMAYEHQGEKFFLAMVEPPKRVQTATIPPREYIFVLDVSGSMWGFPLDTAKKLITDLIGSLRPSDHFNVLLFAGRAAVLFPRSVRANQANINRALTLINQQRGGGGTELMRALRRAYALPRPERHVSRSVVVITDGYVAVENKAFRFIRKHLSEANCFAFGIGSSVNRAIIEGMARAGMGEPFVVLSGKEASAKAAEFRKYVESPVLTDIRVQFQGLQAYDVSPKSVPDLLAQRPLVLFGKYRGALKGRIVITGHSGKGAFKKSLDMARVAAKPANAPIRVLWARKWVADLSDQLAALPGDADIEKAITNLGLGYNLLTRYTSFVAVDSKVVNRSGRTVTVRQPLPLPQGVSNYAVGGFGRRYRGAGRMGSVGGSANPLMAIPRPKRRIMRRSGTRAGAHRTAAADESSRTSNSQAGSSTTRQSLPVILHNVAARHRAAMFHLVRRILSHLPGLPHHGILRMVWHPATGSVSLRARGVKISASRLAALKRLLRARMAASWTLVHRSSASSGKPVVVTVFLR